MADNTKIQISKSVGNGQKGGISPSNKPCAPEKHATAVTHTVRIKNR